MMGTNYYAVKKSSDRKKDLDDMISNLQELEVNNQLDRNVVGIVYEFNESNQEVHLGKSSYGWKFCWNFNDNKWYSSKKELIDFVMSAGAIVDEYGAEQDAAEFLEWALNKSGWSYNEEYVKYHYDDKSKPKPFTAHPDYYDLEIDGLRVSTSTDFS